MAKATRGRRAPVAEEPIKDEDDQLICTIRLASGKFESEIRVPLFADDAEKREFVEAWFNLLEAGLRCRVRKEAIGDRG